MPTSTRIGVDKLYYAPLTTDDGTTIVFGTPVALPGVMKLGVNPNPSKATLFADDGPMETASTLGDIEVEIDKNALSTAEMAALLGHVIDDKGGLVAGGNAVAPYVAIGWRSLKANGKYRYVWLYKGKFMEPEDNNETKGDSVNFQPDTIKGSFVKVNKEYTVDGKKVQPWKYTMDEEDTNVAIATTVATWFNAVVTPTPDA